MSSVSPLERGQWSSGVMGVMISGSSVGLGDGFLAIGIIRQEGKPRLGGECRVGVLVMTSSIEMLVGEERLYFGGKEKLGGGLREDFRLST